MKKRRQANASKKKRMWEYEKVYIRIDFNHKTIEYYAVDEDWKSKRFDDGIHVDIIKASIEVLESGKIEIDFNGGK